MKETNDFIEVHFDQGRTGHIKRKPTTLGTNIYELQHLQGLRGPGSSREGGADELTVEQRNQLSRTWAAWSPGLKNAIVTAVKNEARWKDQETHAGAVEGSSSQRPSTLL